MKKVYGAYLCTGCGIGEVLDVDGLKDAASDAGIDMKEHACLCGADGRAFIEKEEICQFSPITNPHETS